MSKNRHVQVPFCARVLFIILIFMKTHTACKTIPNESPEVLFTKIAPSYHFKFLLESKNVALAYGTMSLIGIEPSLKIVVKNDQFACTALTPRGKKYLEKITEKDLKICDFYKRTSFALTGTITKQKYTQIETKRSLQKNSAQIIRLILQKFATKEKTLLGLYGAFTYDFVRLFEDLPKNLPENNLTDCTLFLYDTFIQCDHLKQTTEIVTIRTSKKECTQAIKKIQQILAVKKHIPKTRYVITKPHFLYTKKEYENLVEKARAAARNGNLFEVVFANTLKAKFNGDPFALYKKYRAINPSSYMFYYDFGDEQLVGASPEMMVRVDGKTVHLRPISGTAKRSKDPIEDHENMLALLNNPKERAELDMLIDLGRNDLSRICKPGITVQDYRFVEKYARVMHTVAHLSGTLRPGYTAFDALIACINAGTLTGAPKVAAMTMIEKNEKERRGYYGGTAGYISFSGDMNTAIIIRTAHIRKKTLSFAAGATLLYASEPEAEYAETQNKSQAFLETFAS